MTTRRHDADVLVLGYSLELAIAAVVAAKSGSKILWLGGVGDTAVQLGPRSLPAAPGLSPSFAHAPTLARVLRDVGLLAEVQRFQKPVSLQLLGERLRISLPEDWIKAPLGEHGIQSLQQMAAVTDELSTTPPQIGFLAERRFDKRRQAVNDRVVAPPGIVGDSSAVLDSLLGRGPASLGATMQTVAAPNDFPGGTLMLGQMLQKKCVTLGARLFPDGLRQRIPELRIGWSGIEGLLPGGEAISARVALVACDDATLERALPEGSPLHKRLRAPDSTPLLRLSLVLRRRGVPQALGPFAIVQGDRPLWVERRRLDDDHDGLSLFWRSSGAATEQQEEQARAALGRVAPFFDRHIVALADPVAVPDHDRIETTPRATLMRRVLSARGPLWNLHGLEGAALVGCALAERAIALAPKKRQSTTA